jgi:hypothetical protein
VINALEDALERLGAVDAMQVLGLVISLNLLNVITWE